MREFGYLDYRHPVIPNLYALQVRKIEKLIAHLHEDLQFDYRELLERLSEPVRKFYSSQVIFTKIPALKGSNGAAFPESR